MKPIGYYVPSASQIIGTTFGEHAEKLSIQDLRSAIAYCAESRDSMIAYKIETFIDPKSAIANLVSILEKMTDSDRIAIIPFFCAALCKAIEEKETQYAKSLGY